MLHDLACPSCGAPGLEPRQPDGALVCKFCGHEYSTHGRVPCPHCDTLNDPHADFCAQCGKKLKRSCPACGFENWAGAEFCSQCGRDLDTLEIITSRYAQGFKDTLQQQRQQAGSLKAGEEAASQKRLAVMWEKERQRQAEMAKDRSRQKAQQNMLLIMAVLVGAAVLCALAGALVFLNLR